MHATEKRSGENSSCVLKSGWVLGEKSELTCSGLRNLTQDQRYRQQEQRGELRAPRSPLLPNIHSVQVFRKTTNRTKIFTLPFEDRKAKIWRVLRGYLKYTHLYNKLSTYVQHLNSNGGRE